MSLTKDEVVKMAREAGFSQDWQFAVPPATLSSFATLCRAPLIAEVERLTFTLNQEALARENVSALRAQLADEVDSLKAERDNWKARAEAAEAKLARVREQEPAGYFVPEGWDALGRVTDWAQVVKNQGTPLYATPPQPAAQEPFAWARPDAVDASQDFRFIKIEDFTVPLYATPTSAVPVVRKMVEALEDAQRAFSPAIHVGVSSAIAAGQQYLKENGK